MTHKDIYTKFVIEYDKANVTSSYPSLTEYEIATVLDKAYNAIIAQKITGNNYRRSVFESDNKAIADLEPLVKSGYCDDVKPDSRVYNCISGELPSEMLYYITAYMKQDKMYKVEDGPNVTSDTDYDPADGLKTRSLQVKLVSHDMATRFFSSPHNIPWIKDPVGYIESGRLYVVYDPINKPILRSNGDVTPIEVVYIKQPHTFVKNLGDYTTTSAYCSYFDWHGLTENDELPEAYQFELNSTMAEELVSLAVAFALENVESARLNSKLNMRGLEA